MQLGPGQVLYNGDLYIAAGAKMRQPLYASLNGLLTLHVNYRLPFLLIFNRTIQLYIIYS